MTYIKVKYSDSFKSFHSQFKSLLEDLDFPRLWKFRAYVGLRLTTQGCCCFFFFFFFSGFYFYLVFDGSNGFPCT